MGYRYSYGYGYGRPPAGSVGGDRTLSQLRAASEGYWVGNSNTTDLSGKGRTLTNNAAQAAWSPVATDRNATRLRFPGGVNYITTPDHASFTPTSTLEIRVDEFRVDWTPSTFRDSVAQWSDGNGQRSWAATVQTNGTLILFLSNDGTTLDTLATSSAATGFTDNTRNRYRITWRQSDGRVQFFTGPSTVDWGDLTQLGTDITGQTTSVFNSSEALRYGYGVQSADPMMGGLYYCQVIVDGSPVWTFDAANVTETEFATTHTTPEGRAVSFVRSASGFGLTLLDRPGWRHNGTSSHLLLADNDAHDIVGGASATAIVAARLHSDIAVSSALFSKKASVSSTIPGWSISKDNGVNAIQGLICDGTNQDTPAGTGEVTYASRVCTAYALVVRAADTTLEDNGGETDTKGRTAVDLSNATQLRIGAHGSGNFTRGYFTGAAFFSEELTPGERAIVMADLVAGGV